MNKGDDKMWRTPMGRLRIVGWLEGTSYLLLLGFGMPMKYLMGQPEFVQVIGWAHGLLFISYVLVVLQAWGSKNLNFNWAVLAMIAAVLPFGPFVLDNRLTAGKT
jgi:integral membrane protein